VPTLITNKTTFTNNNELISKQYVDSTYLALSGGTMTGTLNTTTIDTATAVPLNIGVTNATMLIIGRAGQEIYCPSKITGTTIGLSGGSSSMYLRGGGIPYTRNTCISPFGAPLEQTGVSNFAGTNYSVRSFCMPESIDVTNVVMNRSVLTSTTVSIAIYNSDLTRIFTSTLTATTASTLNFSAGFGMTGGSYYYFAVYGTGTGFYAGTKAGSTIVNSGLSASLQYASFNVASTTLPATLPTTGILISSIIQPPFTLVGY
jgi:hypothetical protein